MRTLGPGQRLSGIEVNTMTANEAVRLVAAFMVLLALSLANWVHPAWLGLSAFVGLNLFQFSFSGLCPALWMLQKAGLPRKAPGHELDAARVAQVIVGSALVVLSAIGYLVPASLFVVTGVGAVLAISFGQSAFTGACPGLTLGRWLARKERAA